MKELVIRIQSTDKLALENAMPKMVKITHCVAGKRGYDDECRLNGADCTITAAASCYGLLDRMLELGIEVD